MVIKHSTHWGMVWLVYFVGFSKQTKLPKVFDAHIICIYGLSLASLCDIRTNWMSMNKYVHIDTTSSERLNIIDVEISNSRIKSWTNWHFITWEICFIMENIHLVSQEDGTLNLKHTRLQWSDSDTRNIFPTLHPASSFPSLGAGSAGRKPDWSFHCLWWRSDPSRFLTHYPNQIFCAPAVHVLVKGQRAWRGKGQRAWRGKGQRAWPEERQQVILRLICCGGLVKRPPGQRTPRLFLILQPTPAGSLSESLEIAITASAAE